MTDPRDTYTGDEHVDDLVRELVTLGEHADEVERRQGESLEHVRSRLEGARSADVATPPRRERRRRVFVLSGLAAAAVLIAVSLAPGGDTGRRAGIAHVTASASAAEALDWAGSAIVDTRDPVGSGPTWHGVSRAYVNGDLASVTEQWFDPVHGTYRAYAWGRVDIGDDQREVLQVVGVDGADTSSLRTYELPEGERDWQLPEETPSPHLVQELPRGYGAGQRTLVRSVHAWLDVFESDPTDAELVAATKAFGAATSEQYFGGEMPEFDRSMLSQSSEELSAPEAQQELNDQVQAGADALRVRPMIYLLTTVQSTPEAMRALYEQIGRFDTLERLPNATIDGREVLRIRYDLVDMGSHRERVLVIDAQTGAPVRVESVDRDSWTQVEPARRVEAIGTDSVLCAEELVPCELLDGRGELAGAWDDYIASDIGQQATEALRDPQNAFATAIALRSQEPDDSAYGVFTGECARDARVLSTCRG